LAAVALTGVFAAAAFTAGCATTFLTGSAAVLTTAFVAATFAAVALAGDLAVGLATAFFVVGAAFFATAIYRSFVFREILHVYKSIIKKQCGHIPLTILNTKDINRGKKATHSFNFLNYLHHTPIVWYCNILFTAFS
jgi:hypothetical protein